MGARRDKKAVSAGPTSVADLPTVSKLVTAKTHKGRRILEKRASKPIEDAKKVLILYGNKASQVLKDVLVDLHKLKRGESIKFTRRNEECRPFEVGGEQRLEFYANKAECGLFALGSHTKKRPHNLVLGRFFDGHLLDAIEMGVQGFASINSFGAKATGAALGSKPCILFVGEKFESVPALKLAKSLVLDLFRGEQVSAINLAGLDRVLVAYAVEDDKLLLRQYVIKFKKSGTRTPKVALEEMGPSLDLLVRRHRPAPHDMEKEAMKKPLIGKKKEKNVSSDSIIGKVGRIYMPKQQVDGMALAKPKGTKRERRNDTAERKAKKHQPESAAGPGPDADAPDAADV